MKLFKNIIIYQKWNVVLFSILMFTFSIQAIGDYEPGEKLFTLSEKGLNLRDKPNANGKKVTLIPFASELTIISKNKANQYSSDGITGHWVEVKYKNFTGFVFDGYLTHILPPTLSCKNFKEFLSKSIGGGKAETIAAGDYEGLSAIRFGKNILYMTEGGDTFTIYFPGISMEELFLIGKICKEISAKTLLLDANGSFGEIFNNNFTNQLYKDENGVTMFLRSI